jgi:hypothetical protein
MTEQPNDQNSTPQIEKLLIDDTSNFQYHAAYMVYSETFDKTKNVNAKSDLNQIIQDLKDGKTDFETFYVKMAPLRNLEVPRHERFQMATQRKKDWRRQSQRQERIKRHKK